MYQNQGFSSGSYEEMLSGAPLLPHDYNNESVGSQHNEFKFITSIGETVTMHHHHHHIDEHSNNATNADPSCNSFSAAADSNVVVSRTQLGLIDADQNIQCQGLSLSLGTVMPSIGSVPQFQYHYPNTTSFSSLMNATMQNLKGNSPLKDGDDEDNLHKELRNAAECMASVSSGGFYNTMKREGLYNNGTQHPSMCLNEGQPDPCLQGSAGFSNTALNSQYLKAAQELLDEIVNVRKALKQPGLEKQQSFRGNGLYVSKDSDGKSTSQSMQVSSGPNGTSTANSSSELSPAERQSLLDKKTKLLAMLDEVDKRYRQYCHQMQIVVSSFDMVAGIGAAEPYTALALRTISRHFRCLRDAISGQIQAAQRSLGEQEGIPRLRYVDQQLRQQKALQQLGVMRQAWRPQRGLPESSVSILRAWLFEHFLHPYPKDSEKIMLARQTGLTRNQVANWFINARVRLWKPMVEEMYKEEFGDSEISCNLLSENSTPKASRDDVQVSDNNKREEESHDNLVNVESNDHGENVMDSSMTRKFQGEQISFNMNNNYSNHVSMQINHNGDDGCLMASNPAAYDLSEFGNFTVGSHVSLALELRNHESNGLGMSNDDDMNKRGNQTTMVASSSETDLLDYHLNESGKQQHKFDNAHMLHEFVV